MNDLQALSFHLDAVLDRLALGLDLFGPYAPWLWTMPALWAITGISLWAYTSWQQRRSDRAYLAYASRQLPLLRRIAQRRAREVASARRTDRF
ncbi:MAG: hypothetical protein R3F54_25925 [Alphaproteobacteria bacterium]